MSEIVDELAVSGRDGTPTSVEALEESLRRIREAEAADAQGVES